MPDWAVVVGIMTRQAQLKERLKEISVRLNELRPEPTTPKWVHEMDQLGTEMNLIQKEVETLMKRLLR